MVMAEDERKVDYIDFEIQEVFEGLCEQVLDYLGVAKGRKFLYDNFPAFTNAVDIKIKAYQSGKRITRTRKTDKPDPEIARICKGYE